MEKSNARWSALYHAADSHTTHPTLQQKLNTNNLPCPDWFDAERWLADASGIECAHTMQRRRNEETSAQHHPTYPSPQHNTAAPHSWYTPNKYIPQIAPCRRVGRLFPSPQSRF
jgi:hypothetical protein